MLQETILSCLASSSWQLEGSVALALNRDPLYWWRKFAATIVMGDDVSTSLAKELSSSSLWQSAASSRCNLQRFYGAHIHFYRGSIREPPRLSYHLLHGH